MNAIADAIKFFEGRSAMAEQLGVSKMAVCHWANGKRRVSPAMAKLIEKKSSGRITREMLRPDIYDVASEGQAA